MTTLSTILGRDVTADRRVMNPTSAPGTAPQTMSVDDTHSRSRLLGWVESLALFVLGATLMTFLYHASTPQPGGEVGVPGHDSFYHIKMAAMLPEWGLVREFPWLRFAYFLPEGNGFVSHHVGFQALMIPFVKVSQWLTGDYLAGGRWAICFFFGLNLVLFNLLLRDAGVRYRWVWLLLFLLQPEHFFTRHAFVRAIAPSLMIMLALLLTLFQRRYVLAAVAVFAWVQLYLGAVMYAPLIVALLAVSMLLGREGEREAPWRMVGWTAGGWLAGVALYPYTWLQFWGVFDFLRLQVFGTGLTPDIEVGQEWKPYNNTWWFVGIAGIVLAVWFLGLCARLRLGPRLNPRELALTLVNLAFLVLTLKARRFVEYWPILCLLNAAYLLAPLEAQLVQWVRTTTAALTENWRRIFEALNLFVGVVIAGMLVRAAAARPDAAQFLAEWRVWGAVAALLMLAPLTAALVLYRRSGDDQPPLLRFALVPLGGALVVGVVALAAAIFPGELPPARLTVSAFAWMALALLYVLVPPLAYAWSRSERPFAWSDAVARTLAVLVVGSAATGLALATAGPFMGRIARGNACYYDLAEVRKMMAFLTANSQPGDVVFTDDWDIFPVYFYYNSHNHYIVGLDPKFTHERRPDLWERYVKISRGETPTTSRIIATAPDGSKKAQELRITLGDIRTEFGARFVITDRDHRAFADKLAREPKLAELIYPGRDFGAVGNAPFLIFRIRDEGEAAPAVVAPRPDERGQLHLSRLNPVVAEQGWSKLAFDTAVEGKPLSLRGVRYERGLGTHAPSKHVFDIPPGYDTFEAVVGVDDETDGQGSATAAIFLDDNKVFESPVLTGSSPPAFVRIPLAGARQLTLVTHPTGDGKRFDHVDWADARLLTTAPASRSAGDQPRAGERK